MLAASVAVASKFLAGTALEFVDAGNVNQGINHTADVPTTDLQAGDLLVLVVSTDVLVEEQPGWTKVIEEAPSAGVKQQVFFKISNGAETDFTLVGSSAKSQSGIIHYRPTGSPVFRNDGDPDAVASGSSTTATSGTVTISNLPSVLVHHIAKAANVTNIGTVSGTNARLLGTPDGSDVNLRAVDEFPSATGTSTARSEAASYNDGWGVATLQFSLNPTGIIHAESLGHDTGDTTDLVFTNPGNLQVGDELIVFAGGDADFTAIPSGWSEISNNSTEPPYANVYRIVATSTEVAASTFTFSTSGTTEKGGVFFVVRGYDYDSTAGVSNSESGTAPSITVSAASSILVGLAHMGINDQAGLFTGMSQVCYWADSVNNINGHAVNQEAVGSGATGTRSLNGSGTRVSKLMAFNPQ